MYKFKLSVVLICLYIIPYIYGSGEYIPNSECCNAEFSNSTVDGGAFGKDNCNGLNNWGCRGFSYCHCLPGFYSPRGSELSGCGNARGARYCSPCPEGKVSYGAKYLTSCLDSCPNDYITIGQKCFYCGENIDTHPNRGPDGICNALNYNCAEDAFKDMNIIHSENQISIYANWSHCGEEFSLNTVLNGVLDDCLPDFIGQFKVIKCPINKDGIRNLEFENGVFKGVISIQILKDGIVKAAKLKPIWFKIDETSNNSVSVNVGSNINVLSQIDINLKVSSELSVFSDIELSERKNTFKLGETAWFKMTPTDTFSNLDSIKTVKIGDELISDISSVSDDTGRGRKFSLVMSNIGSFDIKVVANVINRSRRLFRLLKEPLPDISGFTSVKVYEK